MKRVFLYIDILGFENTVRNNPEKVDQIFKNFDDLKVHGHFALQTVVFSDTVLVFNKDSNRTVDYYCTYLIEYAQELFYRLSAINVYYKGVLTYGEFNFNELNNIQAYYGLALIDAYNDEKELNGFGLYSAKTLSNEIVVFDKVSFSGKYDFILLCQSLKNLYNKTNGVLPVDLNLLTETDTYHRIDEDLRFLREIDYLRKNHPLDKVKSKYQHVYDRYKNHMPEFFDLFEKEGFMPTVINSEFMGSINPYELISKSELNQ